MMVWRTGRRRWLLSMLLLPLSMYAQHFDPKIANIFSSFNGKSFPLMELEDSSGRLFNTAQLKGKIVYLDFWFTLCPPCIKEIPQSKVLQQQFQTDTNLVFVSICIENQERKVAWKQMLQEKAPGGIQLFYARNRPQKYNLLRMFNVYDYPTYLLLDDLKVIGYDAPAPSQQPWVHWALRKALQHVPLHEAYKQMFTKEYRDFRF